MYGQPRLVAKRLLASILRQMPDAEALHGWEPKEVVTHFAYLLPEGKRFTEDDVDIVLNKVNIGQHFAAQLLRPLVSDGVLTEDRVIQPTLQSLLRIGPARWSKRYYMPKSARINHESRLQDLRHDPEPERRSVSERLQAVASNLTDLQQKTFLDETLKCLKVDANRAAIVMAWNLAFDHLRQWVFRHQLADFNKKLVTRLERRNKNYAPVVIYEDFPWAEAVILDVCEEAGLIEGHERDVLREGLKKRNRYAHPSSVVATPAIAAGHIEDLLQHVVLNSKFAW